MKIFDPPLPLRWQMSSFFYFFLMKASLTSAPFAFYEHGNIATEPGMDWCIVINQPNTFVTKARAGIITVLVLTVTKVNIMCFCNLCKISCIHDKVEVKAIVSVNILWPCFMKDFETTLGKLLFKNFITKSLLNCKV